MHLPRIPLSSCFHLVLPPPRRLRRSPLDVILAEVRAETVSISQATQTDTPRPPGSKQTINGDAHIIAA